MLGVLHSLGYTRGIPNDLKFPRRCALRAHGGTRLRVGVRVAAARPRPTPSSSRGSSR